MKYVYVIFFLALSTFQMFAQVPQIGKSMGRWTGFGLESMKANKAAGLDYIEVTMNNVIGKDTAGVWDRATAIKADIDSAGLKVWSVHMPYSRTLDISMIDDVKRAENVHHILHPSAAPITPDEREQRLANSHASIGELAPVAKEIVAVLCIENLPRTCLGQNGEEMMRLIEGYDEVGLCFDTNHLLYQSHADYLKAVEKGKIKTVHLSDYDFADERHLIPGEGLIDNQALWAGIKESGYDGIMMFECYGEPAQPDNSGKDSLAFLNASWEITDLGKGAKAMYAQIPMFYSTQSVCVVTYPMKNFRTDILHRPEESAGKPSEIGREVGAAFALNGGYFHVKQRIPWCISVNEISSSDIPILRNFTV